jgi:acetyltransferase-like isoleucine patch superfamily enzyme
MPMQIDLLGFPKWLVSKYFEEFRSEKELADLKRRNPTATIRAGITIRSPARLELGERTVLDSGSFYHCGGMDWSQGRGAIKIGHDCYVGPQCVLFGAGEIEIGNNVLISPGVIITSHQHSYSDPNKMIDKQEVRYSKVVIENNCWIGCNAVILPGVTTQTGSVIAAGAVVRESVGPHSMHAGVPARERKVLKPDEAK